MPHGERRKNVLARGLENFAECRKMAPRSLRRAVFSWILLLLIAAGVGWVTSRQEGPADARPLAGAVRFLVGPEAGSP